MNVDTVTGTTISKKRERLAAYRAMRRRATEWLLAQMNPDGSIGDPRQGFFFYRGPGASPWWERLRQPARSVAGFAATCFSRTEPSGAPTGS